MSHKTHKIPGKCILAGEHSVVRGRHALVTALPSFSLTLDYAPAAAFSVAPGPLAGPFTAALKEVAPPPPFHFSVASDIPTSAGLGSSAALSVAIARFLREQGLRESEFALALRMENLFHGKSSGLDIAAVLHEGPILFRRGFAAVTVPTAWRPRLYLLDTGLRSSTRACVEKVMAFSATRPDLDDRMEAAVFLMEASLRTGERSLLATGMKEAAACFTAWDLVPPPVRDAMTRLENAGALAVKPTGSGDGGFLLSLWEEAPPAHLSLIPVWADS